MHFLREMKWTPLNIVKALAVAFVVLIFASFVYSFVSNSLGSARFGRDDARSFSISPQAAYYGEMDYAVGEAGYGGGLSTRNVAFSTAAITPSSSPLPPMPGGYVSGTTAEAFEITEYSASIETQNKTETCAQVGGLKARTYVIFESANDHDRGCDFRFKVEHSRVEEVLTFIRGLDPKDLNENTYTIKDLVDDYTSEAEVLENKRRAIDQTLEEAIAAYDDITAVASANQDAESLARIIDSKIQLIERLTQERININTQLDRLARAKAEQLDRLAYTYFNVSAYENKYLDRESLADSWKNSVRMTIHDVNRAIQDATLGLITLLFLAIQWTIYLLLALFIGRHVWQWATRIWTGKPVSAAPKNGSRRKSVGNDVEAR